MENSLSSEDRLSIVQKADRDRKWNSLDDHRVCILCNQVISGREIRIRVDPQGRYELHCPTDGCAATVKDWVYPDCSGSSQESLNSQKQEREIDFGTLFGDASAT
jgi:hypothetical protein